MRYDAQQAAIDACCRQLVAEQVIEPLSTDEADSRDWNLFELASLVEGHLHFQLPDICEDARLVIERRVTYNGEPLASPHGGYRRPFWLLSAGRRAGTLAIDTMISGFDLISLSSLYVEPALRGRGLARQALEAVFRAAVASGAGGMRLDASWTWQPSVRFYARIGMWVRMWKHNLVFTWQRRLPPYRVEIGELEARFLIQQGDGWRTAVTARHLGDRLGWEQEDLAGQAPDEAYHCAPGTFALHLALAGWPLIRSEETWERRYDWCDSGQPEGLAYKIEIFEAVDRQRGFDVRTPRISGIEYRDLDEI